MKQIFKTIALAVLGIGMVVGVAQGASVFFPYQGGTGTGTVPTPGQVPIGATGGIYAPGFITAGDNVTISTSSGSIIINSSAPGGSLTYYMINTSSTPATFKTLHDTPTSTDNTFTIASVASGTQIAQYITDVGAPGISFIPAGSYVMHIHASEGVAGTAALQGCFWEVNAAGADVAQIGCTDFTANLTTANVEYIKPFVNANVYNLASTTSRIAIKITARTASLPTVNIFTGGNNDSHIELPSATVTVNNFVPYVGATKNLDLGLFSIAASNIYASSTWLKVLNNLSDLNNVSTARTNLGLGSIATMATTDYLSSTTQYVATTTGSWLGTWQSKNPSDFLSSSTSYQAPISAGSNIVLTGASVAVTSTPSFASLGVTGNASINGTNSFFTVGTSTPGAGQFTLRGSGITAHDFVVQDNSTPTNFTAITAYNPSGWKNPLVQAGDAGIHFSTTTNGFFIAPYSGSASGLRMATSGVVSVNSSQVITKATNKKYIQWSASYSTSTQTWFTPIFTFPNSATITKVLENSTSTGNNLTYNLYYSTSNTPKASMFKVFSADRTLTALSAPTSTTTFASSTPAAMSGLWIDQYNASSTDLNITIEWIEN